MATTKKSPKSRAPEIAFEKYASEVVSCAETHINLMSVEAGFKGVNRSDLISKLVADDWMRIYKLTRSEIGFILDKSDFSEEDVIKKLRKESLPGLIVVCTVLGVISLCFIAVLAWFLIAGMQSDPQSPAETSCEMLGGELSLDGGSCKL